MRARIVAIELGSWRSGRVGSSPWAETFGNFRHCDLRLGFSFSGGGKKAFPHEECVRRDTEGCVMVESPPAAALIMSQADLILELLVVSLDTPSLFGRSDEFF